MLGSFLFNKIGNRFALSTQQCRLLRTKPSRKMPIPKFDKRLDVAIIGQPNVGKSVLLNCLVKHKISAATRKRHTTRSNIVGVFNHRNVQLVFYDTPGFVRQIDAQKADIKALRTMSTTMASKADVVLLVVDASKTTRPRHICRDGKDCTGRLQTRSYPCSEQSGLCGAQGVAAEPSGRLC